MAPMLWTQSQRNNAKFGSCASGSESQQESEEIYENDYLLVPALDKTI